MGQTELFDINRVQGPWGISNEQLRWNQSNKTLDAVLAAFTEAIGEQWEAAGNSAQDLLYEFQNFVKRYSPRGPNEKVALDTLRQKMGEYEQEWINPEETYPSYDVDERLDTWSEEQYNSPTLWREFGLADESRVPWGSGTKPEDWNEGVAMKALPWWDPLIDPDADVSDKKAIQDGTAPQGPNIFNKAAWNQYTEDYLRDYLYDPWTC